MEAPPQGYRRNVAICLVNDSKIFAASRLDIPSAWQMPQAEDSRSAAIREIREETGVKSAESLAEAVDFKKPVYKEVLAAFTPHLP
ncbi:hypothetical protein C1H46_021645 [Malus baccata]|uniref:Nudix hydrolase domain-containing protein n=1 Tax=Malus baccata TaxID=106549 RepID=A0A540M1Y6_MALBA|nr:hypothetical protein C1H46_021645 [Malus baccata]